MTTIATDGRSIAADGQTTQSQERISTTANKLMMLADGSVVGGAGDADAWPQAVAVLAKALETGTPGAFKGEFALLRLTPAGKAILYWENLIPVPLSLPAAIGSGKHFAIGAMLAGLLPVDAVRAAAKRDVNTGGRVRSITMRP